MKQIIQNIHMKLIMKLSQKKRTFRKKAEDFEILVIYIINCQILNIKYILIVKLYRKTIEATILAYNKTIYYVIKAAPFELNP